MAELWGHIDHDGNWFTPPTYEHVTPFLDGMACVLKDGLYGFIDRTGKQRIPHRYKAFTYFRGGICGVDNASGGTDFIDKDGVVQFSVDCISSGEFGPEGLAPAWKDGPGHHHGFINRQGEIVVPLKYGSVERFSEGYAVIRDGRGPRLGQAWFMDARGNLQFGPYQDASIFSEGKAAVKENGVWHFIDRRGKLLFHLPKHLKAHGGFHEGLASIASLDEVPGYPDCKYLYGAIDETGAVVIPPQFFGISYFTHGIAVAQAANKKYGIIDRQGAYILKPTYDYMDRLCEGKIACEQSGKRGYLDANGKVVLPLKYLIAQHFSEGVAGVAIEQ